MRNGRNAFFFAESHVSTYPSPSLFTFHHSFFFSGKQSVWKPKTSGEMHETSPKHISENMTKMGGRTEKIGSSHASSQLFPLGQKHGKTGAPQRVSSSITNCFSVFCECVGSSGVFAVKGRTLRMGNQNYESRNQQSSEKWRRWQDFKMSPLWNTKVWLVICEWVELELENVKRAC